MLEISGQALSKSVQRRLCQRCCVLAQQSVGGRLALMRIGVWVLRMCIPVNISHHPVTLHAWWNAVQIHHWLDCPNNKHRKWLAFCCHSNQSVCPNFSQFARQFRCNLLVISRFGNKLFLGCISANDSHVPAKRMGNMPKVTTFSQTSENNTHVNVTFI